MKIHMWEGAKIPLSLHFTLFSPYWRESRVLRSVRKVENILIKSGLFNLGGKKQLYVQDSELEILVVDVAEHEIERPKKNRRSITVASKNVIQ